MCGILGTINLDFNDETLQLLHHRGPDATGLLKFFISDNRVTFGHTRLSIIDLSEAGSQPMESNDRNYAIIFNGEIYNHLDLREKLKEIKFRGHSDTETILYYIAKFGFDAVKDLNGIFAFAFLDKNKKANAKIPYPFGVKPLYYSFRNASVAFSSELKTILKLMPQNEINTNHLYTFLRLRYNPSPQTLYKNIYKLEPGHFLKIDLTKVSPTKPVFYSYVPQANNTITELEALEQYDLLLNQAVKRQLLSDVPISILLSGGVDSALLACLAQKVSGEKFTTYTAGYQINTEVNEREDAAFTARWLGSDHKEVIIEENDFLENLPTFIKIIEEPLGSQSIVPMYYLAQAIHKDGFKVALTGQGVDEPWGGYPKYNPQAFFENAPSRFLSMFSGLGKNIKKDQWKRAFNSITEPNCLKRFVATCSVFDNQDVHDLTNGNFNQQHAAELEQLFNYRFEQLKLTSQNVSNALMAFDARMNLSDDLLLYTDKISMHHSLEVRVPFLDVELVKFVESLPYNFKVTLFKNKILHKKLAEKYLPKEIIYRKKKHFATPRKEWFKTNIGKKYEDMMCGDKSTFGNIFKKEYIHQLFHAHRTGKVNYEKKIYLLVNVYYWLNGLKF